MIYGLLEDLGSSQKNIYFENIQVSTLSLALNPRHLTGHTEGPDCWRTKGETPCRVELNIHGASGVGWGGGQSPGTSSLALHLKQTLIYDL